MASLSKMESLRNMRIRPPNRLAQSRHNSIRHNSIGNRIAALTHHVLANGHTQWSIQAKQKNGDATDCIIVLVLIYKPACLNQYMGR